MRTSLSEVGHIDIQTSLVRLWAIGNSSRTVSLPSLATDSLFSQLCSEVRFISRLYYDGLNGNVVFLGMVSQMIIGLR
jgi:hypothetical protein